MGDKEDIAYIKDKLEMIERALIGDIENTDKPGIVERVKKLEDHSSCVKRFSWVAISSFVGIFLTALIKLLGVKF